MFLPASSHPSKSSGRLTNEQPGVPATELRPPSSRLGRDIGSHPQRIKPLLDTILPIKAENAHVVSTAGSDSSTSVSKDKQSVTAWLQTLQSSDGEMGFKVGVDDEESVIVQRLDHRLSSLHTELELERERRAAEYESMKHQLTQFNRERRERKKLNTAEDLATGLSRAMNLPDGQEATAALEQFGFLPPYGFTQTPLLPPIPAADEMADFTKTTVTAKLHQSKPSVVPTHRNKPGPNHHLPPIIVKSSGATAEQEASLIQILASRRSYAVNPRTKATSTIKTSSSVHCTETVLAKPWFTVEPAEVVFRDVDVGSVYEETFRVRNTSGISRCVHCRPANDPNFSIVKYDYPGDVSIIAPGMALQCTVQFSCQEAVETESAILVLADDQNPVTLLLRAVPTVFKLDWLPNSNDELDCGYAVVGSSTEHIFTCTNNGAAGDFILVDPAQSSANLEEGCNMLCAEEFFISPCRFHLASDESTDIIVTFQCSTLQPVHRCMKVIFNNTQASHVLLAGGGELAEVTVFGDGVTEETEADAVVDPQSSSHLLRRFAVDLPPTNPGMPSLASAAVESLCHTDLRYEWRVALPARSPPFSSLTIEQAASQCPPQAEWTEGPVSRFAVKPITEVLPSCTSADVRMQFCCDEVGEYSEAASLWVKLPTIGDSSESGSEEQSESSSSSSRTEVCVAVLRMTAHVEPHHLVVNPPALVFPPMLLRKEAAMTFRCKNSSLTSVDLDWSETAYTQDYAVSITPCRCSIAAGTEAQFSVTVLAESVTPLQTDLTCRVSPGPSLLSVAVMAMNVSAAEVVMQEPRLSFGVLRKGTSRTLMLPMRNLSDTVAHITLRDTSAVSRLQFLPSAQFSLPPLGTSTPVLSLLADSCCVADTVVECCVQDGQTSYLAVTGSVERTDVRLLPNIVQCDDEFYVGVPYTFQAKLRNWSQLPTVFSWKGPVGPKEECCSIAVSPANGLLDSLEEIAVEFTITVSVPGELDNLLIGCDVQDMEQLVLLQVLGCVRGPQIFSNTRSIEFSCRVNNFVEMTVDLINPTPAPVVVYSKVVKFPAASTAKDPADNSLSSQSSKTLATGGSHDLNKTYMNYSQSFRLKQQQREAREVLGLRRGAAFEIDPPVCDVPALSTVSITVRAQTDMWGEYRDALVCQAQYMTDFYMPIVLKAEGCPLSFATASLVEGKAHHTLLCFGSKACESPLVQRPVIVANNSPDDIRLDWRLFTMTDLDNEQDVELDLVIGDPFPCITPDGGVEERAHHGIVAVDPVKRDSVDADRRDDYVKVRIGHHVSDQSDAPFSMSTPQMVVPGYSRQTVYAVFDPSAARTTGIHSVVARGYLSLDASPESAVVRLQGYEVEHMQLRISAELQPPRFTVQQLGEIPWTLPCGVLIEDQGVQSAHVFRRTFMLHNECDNALIASVLLQPPLHVMTSSTMPSARIGSCATSSSLGQSLPSSTLSSAKPIMPVKTTAQSTAHHTLPGIPERATPIPSSRPLQIESAVHSAAVKSSQRQSSPWPLVSGLQLDSVVQCDAHSLVSLSIGFNLTDSWLKHVVAKVRDRGDVTVEGGEAARSSNGDICFHGDMQLEFHYGVVQEQRLDIILQLPRLEFAESTLDCGWCHVGNETMKLANIKNPSKTTARWRVADFESDVFFVSPREGVLPADANPAECSAVIKVTFKPRSDVVHQQTLKLTVHPFGPPIALQLVGKGTVDEAKM